MGEIRFVGIGETRGYPYLMCKKKFVFIAWSIRRFYNMIVRHWGA